MSTWDPYTWQQFTVNQEVKYQSEQQLNDVITNLSNLPPLVTSLEVDALRRQIAQAARGKAFLLQGGDCAESFDECHEAGIKNKLKILLQMSLVLLHGLRKPIIRVGRIAGQYAKPRSSDTETIDGVTLPSYRGDLINRQDFDAASRQPNPKLLLQGYSCAAMTLNYIRALLDGGFADLQHSQRWNLDLAFVNHSTQKDEYNAIAKSIADSLDFLKVVNGLQSSSLSRVDFFTSHEALSLYYEQALTRKNSAGKWYNLSTHFPWVGMRTAQLDGAHLAYLKGIENPLGIKVGPSATSEWLEQLLNILNPDNIPGRITLITRFGANQVEKYLPNLITDVRKMGKTVLWSCDPMHGNTQTTAQGYKTRHFDDILLELQHAFRIHHQLGSYLGGVHFELSGENVTECIGGARGLSEEDLNKRYKTLVDPRLNYEQALEMAMLITRCVK